MDQAEDSKGRQVTRSSIRARLRVWTVSVSTLTLAAFTTAGILEERRQLLATEAGHASALLEHLTHMPEFQGTAAEAETRVALLRGSLGTIGARLEIAPPGSGDGPRPWAILARRRLALADSELELRYRVDPARIRDLTRRPALIHSLHGIVALAALVAGTEWILRRKLLVPLQAMSHQVELMREGHGWAPRLPGADEELRELSDALLGLGPGLERQVHEWIEAERRGAAALALAGVRRPLRQARDRARELLADLAAAGGASPNGPEPLVRELAEQIEAMTSAVDAAAREPWK